MFPQPFIEDLRMHADIVQVIQEYVSLRKTGATYKGLCPFHSEKTPSFHVTHFVVPGAWDCTSSANPAGGEVAAHVTV